MNYRPALGGFANTQPRPIDDRKAESAPANPFVPEFDVRHPRTFGRESPSPEPAGELAACFRLSMYNC